MADKDFPRLRKDASFQKLSAAHQAILVEYCRDGGIDTPEVRETDAVSMADSLAAVEEAVRQTFLAKLKEDWRRSPRLIGMTGTSTWEKPVMNGKPAAGAEVSNCRRRLIQIFSLLRDRELSANAPHRKELLTNTIEWFIFANLPIEFATTSDASLMGEYVSRHAMILYHESLLKITPDGIGDKGETLRKLAHEVNHACRRNEDTSSDGGRLVDEVFAYVTELIAAGNVVTEGQIGDTFKTLSGPPYNLSKVIKSPAGVEYRTSIKYQDHPVPDSNPVIFPLPSPGTKNAGWHHTNAVPGLR